MIEASSCFTTLQVKLIWLDADMCACTCLILCHSLCVSPHKQTEQSFISENVFLQRLEVMIDSTRLPGIISGATPKSMDKCTHVLHETNVCWMHSIYVFGNYWMHFLGKSWIRRKGQLPRSTSSNPLAVIRHFLS